MGISAKAPRECQIQAAAVQNFMDQDFMVQDFMDQDFMDQDFIDVPAALIVADVDRCGPSKPRPVANVRADQSI